MTTQPSEESKREEELRKMFREEIERMRKSGLGEDKGESEEIEEPEPSHAIQKRRARIEAPVILEPDEIRASSTEGRPRKGGGVTPIMLVIGIVVAVIISIFYSNSNLVSKTDFTANTNNILNTVGQVQTDLKTAQTNITNAINGIPNQVSSGLSATNTKLATDEAKLASIQTSITDLTNQVNGFATSNTNTINDIASIKTQLATLGSLSSTVTALQSQLKTDEATIADLQKSVTALQATTTTPPPETTTTTAPSNAVTATYYNSPMIFQFSSTKTDIISTFGINIANTTAKDLVHVALTITLQPSINLDGNGINYELKSKTGTFSWDVTQGTGNRLRCTSDAYIYVSSGNEMSDVQTLELILPSPPLGNVTYTVSVTSVVMDTKTLQ